MIRKGLTVTLNIIYQDNTSRRNLEENGKCISGKRTCHCDMHYFYVTALVRWNELKIKYCPTYGMIANCMIKSLVGGNVNFFLHIIINLSDKHHHIVQEDSVGWNILGIIRNLVQWDKRYHSYR